MNKGELCSERDAVVPRRGRDLPKPLPHVHPAAHACPPTSTMPHPCSVTPTRCASARAACCGSRSRVPGTSPPRPAPRHGLVRCSSVWRAIAPGPAMVLQCRGRAGGLPCHLRAGRRTAQRRSSLESPGEPATGVINHCCYYSLGTKRRQRPGCTCGCCHCKHRLAAVWTPRAPTDPDQPRRDGRTLCHGPGSSVRTQLGCSGLPRATLRACPSLPAAPAPGRAPRAHAGVLLQPWLLSLLPGHPVQTLRASPGPRTGAGAVTSARLCPCFQS